MKVIQTHLCALVVVVSGCSPVDIPKRDGPSIDVPISYTMPGGGTPFPQQYWHAFGDDTLDDVVQRSLVANFDLKQAWARLAQAKATARIIGAPLLPAVDLNSSLARTRSDSHSGVGYNSSWAVGFGLSWEIDIWRKLANRAQAAILLANASRQDVEQTALVLTGTVTDLWFTVREQADLVRVINEQVRLSEKLLETVENRYVNGLAGALAVYQQRQQLEGVRTQLPLVLSRLETSLNALQVLQGATPESVDIDTIEASLPDLPPLPELGSPMLLLEHRPELRAARDRLAAADREVAAAVADMLPSIRFSVGYDWQSQSISDPFTSGLASIGGSLFQPVFDNDRRGAEVVRHKAIVQERLAAFSQAFLEALREVEDALDQERFQIDYIDDLTVRYRLAIRELETAGSAYADGAAEYLDVINAVQTRQGLQRELVAARRDLLAYRTALYRALGGTWMHDLNAPLIDQELEADVAADLGLEGAI